MNTFIKICKQAKRAELLNWLYIKARLTTKINFGKL